MDLNNVFNKNPLTIKEKVELITKENTNEKSSNENIEKEEVSK